MSASPSACDPIADPGFLSFAQIHLAASAHGSFAIGDGFATYAAFVRRRGTAPLSRANFGASVLALARSVGGCRADDIVSGLVLQRPVCGPAHERLRDPPKLVALPSEPRLLAALPLPTLEETPARDIAADATPEDAVGAFLASRLCERHGAVLSLETLRTAIRADGLRFADVLERARARGHAVRRNAWGPDFLTDALLVDRREGAE